MSSKKINIDVYTDGSCKKVGGKPKCGYGIYFPVKDFKQKGEIIHLSDMAKPFTRTPLTNQRAELYAIYKAIKKIDKKLKFDTIHIYSDSEYSIKSLTVWIKEWKKNGWKTANKKPVQNVDIIMKIDKKLQKYKGSIFFTHVYSHTGKQDIHSLGNEEADKLANIGCEKC